jgi:hypothetical protein
MQKKSDAARIREYYEKHPNAKPGEVAKALKVKPGSVYVTRQKMKNTFEVAPFPVAADPAPLTVATDPVNHPPHYKTGGIETIDFIEAKGLNYRLGNVVKYITRAEHKGNRKEDLQKALWYLQREIDQS